MSMIIERGSLLTSLRAVCAAILIAQALPACSNASEEALPLAACLPGVWHGPLQGCPVSKLPAADPALESQPDCMWAPFLALDADGTMREGWIYLSESERALQTPQFVGVGTWQAKDGKLSVVRNANTPVEDDWEETAVCTETELHLSGLSGKLQTRLLPPREQAAKSSLQTNAVVKF